MKWCKIKQDILIVWNNVINSAVQKLHLLISWSHQVQIYCPSFCNDLMQMGGGMVYVERGRVGGWGREREKEEEREEGGGSPQHTVCTWQWWITKRQPITAQSQSKSNYWSTRGVFAFTVQDQSAGAVAMVVVVVVAKPCYYSLLEKY